MDCPCEENLIRMRLETFGDIASMEFDLAQRRLTILHSGEIDAIDRCLQSLHLGAVLLHTDTATEQTNTLPAEEDRSQRSLLIRVLTINAVFFLLEIIAGLLYRSMGLVADSLDMLADALVYGMALAVVGASVSYKKRIAFASGCIQVGLALLGIAEVARRFVGAELFPSPLAMIIMSAFALGANVWCLILLQRSRSNEAHIRASVIFSANDVIINSGVILSGIIVWLTESRLPDLLIGCIVFLIVMRGAWRILQLSR